MTLLSRVKPLTASLCIALHCAIVPRLLAQNVDLYRHAMWVPTLVLCGMPIQQQKFTLLFCTFSGDALPLWRSKCQLRAEPVLPPQPAEPAKSADSTLGTVSATLQLPAELPEHSYWYSSEEKQSCSH